MNSNLSENTYRKFIEQIDVNDYQVETDDGFVDIVSINKTIPYLTYYVETEDELTLTCADKHIVFKNDYSEVYVEDLKQGDEIITQNGISKIKEIKNLGYEENMYDLELSNESNHRYYTNGILSHNTLIAKKLAEEVFGDEKSLIRIDMSEYSEKNSVARLTGAAPGYIGYESGGQLTEAIKNKQHCVLLLDEIEKANQEIYNLFLQLFDDGRLTDSSGQVVNFKNVIVLMTSNIGAKKATEFGHKIGFLSSEGDNKKSIIEKEMKGKFTPEFLNRIDKIVYFNNLTDDDLRKITVLEIDKFVQRVKSIGYNIIYSDSVVDYIFRKAIKEKEYGARPIIRLVQNELEDKVTDKILTDNYENGHTFNLDCHENDVIVN